MVPDTTSTPGLDDRRLLGYTGIRNSKYIWGDRQVLVVIEPQITERDFVVDRRRAGPLLSLDWSFGFF